MDSLPIHIAFCINDNYAKYVAVTIKSILANNGKSQINFHVLSDWISAKNKKLLNTIISGADATMTIHIVDDSKLRGLKTNNYTIYTWYRILIPELFDQDIQRVLYLDSDIIVAGDISALFGVDMSGKSIASTLDDQFYKKELYAQANIPYSLDYICAGVLLMNLSFWRKHDFSRKMIEWAKANDVNIRFPDQDAINHICHETKIILPLKYGVTPMFFYDDYFKENMTDEYLECVFGPLIIHYNHISPWFYEARHPHLKLWRVFYKQLYGPFACLRFREKLGAVQKMKSYIWHKLHYKLPERLHEEITTEARRIMESR